MLLLTIDIGNSSINIGFFNNSELIVRKIDTYPLRPSSEYSSIFQAILRENHMDKRPAGCIISSVVPGHTETLKSAAKKVCGSEPVWAGSKAAYGLRLSVDADELGADRMASALAAVEIYGPPVAVVDFGTATTVNFVGEGKVFKGGAILPGVGLMAVCLKEHTAKLPLVSPEAPASPIGGSTRDSILSGIIYGTAGAVERIISEAEEAGPERYKVILTGGYAGVVSPYMKRADAVEPNLLLKGLKIIYEKERHA